MNDEAAVNQPARKQELNDLQKAELRLKEIEIAEREQALADRADEAEFRRLELVEKRAEADSKNRKKARGLKTQQAAAQSMLTSQESCNHHCGGDGALGIQTGQGDMARPTCIGGIQFLDGTIKLSCERCGKPWRSDMPSGGQFNGKLHGPWNEGVLLWRSSQNKVFSVVGGLKVQQTTPRQI